MLPARIAFGLTLLSALPARADFKEWTLSLQPIYALPFVEDRDLHGGGAGADLAFGVTDSLSVRVAGAVTWHAVPQTLAQPRGVASTFAAVAGVRYSLDVIRIVPSFDLGIGVVGVRGGARFARDAASNATLGPATAVALELGFGIDYLITRRVSLGAVLRYHALLSELTYVPSFLYVGPRVSFRFGG